MMKKKKKKFPNFCLLKLDMRPLSSSTGPYGTDYWAILFVLSSTHDFVHYLVCACVDYKKERKKKCVDYQRGGSNYRDCDYYRFDMKKMRCCSVTAVALLLFISNVLAGKCLVVYESLHVANTWVKDSTSFNLPPPHNTNRGKYVFYRILLSV